MSSRIHSLECCLDEERDANKEMRLVTGLIERVLQLESAKEQQPPRPTQETVAAPVEPPGEEAQRKPEKQSWWRRLWK